jgi:hypothetical protein
MTRCEFALQVGPRRPIIAVVGPRARDGGEARTMEMAIGILLAVIAAVEILVISRTVIRNTPT